ncbi:MAG TPA: ATP-binding protein, partial [Solirubrobacterales bacterium]|nr:ATP-binding protein [Solirubrobacterales bacterium]
MQTTRSGNLRASLPLPPLRASRTEFGLDDLHDLRAQVTAAATAVGLSPGRVADLVAAASELAANSVLHGGGRGLATIWGEDGAAFVEVADAGRITDPEVGT